MSGEKSSTIIYDRRGEIILDIRSTKENLLRNIRFLKQQIEGLLKRIEKEKPSIKDRNLKKILDGYANTLNERSKNLAKKEEAIDNFSIKTSAKIKELQRDQKALVKEYDYNKRIADELQSINQRISEIMEIENLISRVEADIFDAENLMRNNSGILKEWTPKEYEALDKESDVLKKKFDKYVGDMGSGKTDTPDLSSIKEIYKGVRNHINKIENVVTDYAVKDKELKILKKRIEQLRQDISEQAMSTKDSVIKTILSDYLSRLKMDETEIEKKKYEGIDKRLDSISHNLPLLKKVDEINSNIETEMSNIESIFKENDAILRKWVMNEYETCLKYKEEILGELNRYKNELQTGKVADISRLNNILTEARNLSDKIALFLSIAIEKDKLHQKRLYIIQSLREVCASLGFKEIDKPHYEEKDNAYSYIVQSFDTLNLGTITFHVALEGKIESSSGITIDKCDEEFSKVSELLKEQFGIETSFRRVEEGEPIKKYKTAKDLPTSAGKLSQRK